MKINKNIILVIVSLILMVGIFFLSSLNSKKKEFVFDESMKYVEITIKNYGKIVVELDYDTAPITVENFIKLVNNKFYDGLTFHRILKGFMIQGGAYDVEGNRKETNLIKGEFSSNGIENNLKHERGVISMARSVGSYDSASSQFFIMQEDKTSLDGNYAAFGKVLTGMDVVDDIANSADPGDDNGSIRLDERPVIESIRIVDLSK